MTIIWYESKDHTKKKNCNNIEHIITTEKKGDHRPSAEHVWALSLLLVF